MNIRAIRGYAPQARRDFIQAVTDRAAYFGLTAKKIEPVVTQGDVAVIGGRSHPREVAKKRKQLEDRIKRHGFEQTMEALAYTWFNRLVAIRFMELHGYLDHGYRVLSPRKDTESTEENQTQGSSFRVSSVSVRGPEILEFAEHVDLPGLKKETVIDLKLAGNKESELYRLLLTAQCNALNSAMPFLFERIDDETELVLPDNLLHSDSLIRKLVNEIDEEDWHEVEIIGWLYQFYISEKKDEVIGKVVASEDIPAATQLFTPNWIVKYLVQNTLGRQWLATYPQSALRQQMAYYIEPAEQTPEVQEQLKAITPTTLNPEELTLLDPACGSAHILVEGYDVFKAIYQERGYRAKDTPRLILQKNLFGLEIDDRAAQLAAFALMMKARADDRHIFTSGVKPNVLAIQESKGLDARSITDALNAPILKEKMPPSQYLMEEMEDEDNPHFSRKAMSEKGHVALADVSNLLELFEDAKTFGSLIQVPPTLIEKLPSIDHRLRDVLEHGDLTHASAIVITPLLQQAGLLARRYDAVVANPPYMGSGYFTPLLKTFVNKQYKEAKADLYACFMTRNAALANFNGFVGMITIPNWMFLSSFEEFRNSLLGQQTIDTFIHNGRGIFGSDFGSCSFVFRNAILPAYCGTFRRLFEKQGSVANNEELEQRFHTAANYVASNAEFAKIPGAPLAYWASHSFKSTFTNHRPAQDFFFSDGVTKTGNNERFLRFHWELSSTDVRNKERYRFCAKGGAALRYYGNCDTVIKWDSPSRDHFRKDHVARISPEYVWELPGVTWTDISARYPTFRFMPSGYIAETAGPVVFPKANEEHIYWLLGALHTPFAFEVFKLLNPTVHTKTIDVLRLPLADEDNTVIDRVKQLVEIAREDWDSHETSWDYQSLPILHEKAESLKASQEAADAKCVSRLRRMKELEEENNFLFVHAYGLQGELSHEVPDGQSTLYHPDRLEDVKRLLSYAIGCMMGRYSLDKPGLVYAHSGNVGFDPSKYKTFPADDDGIIPLLDADWGIRDDAANRIVEFIGVAWPKEHLEENLKFLADSLGSNNGEQARETIRRYLATGFYKHHLSMYKKRPIYWLWVSGKQRAFQCLVYLHRYHEGTLARMRTEYVIPLQGQITARIEQLEGDKAKATSTSHRNKIQKEQDKLKKQQAELLTFEEKLKHAADQKISLDLDDGVKVNYAKFGDLLAESKAITGGKEEE